MQRCKGCIPRDQGASPSSCAHGTRRKVTPGAGMPVLRAAAAAAALHAAPPADYALTPHMAIVDPQLVLNMPKKLTAWGGIDALTHALESYVSVCATGEARGPGRCHSLHFARRHPPLVLCAARCVGSAGGGGSICSCYLQDRDCAGPVWCGSEPGWHVLGTNAIPLHARPFPCRVHQGPEQGGHPPALPVPATRVCQRRQRL